MLTMGFFLQESQCVLLSVRIDSIYIYKMYHVYFNLQLPITL